MKWIAIALFAALLLIGAGILLNRPGGDGTISSSPEALALCDEGTADMHAFRLRDAIEKLGRSLDLDPSLAEASIARTLAYYRLGETDHFTAELGRADSLTALIGDDQRRLVAQLRLGMIGKSRFFDIRDSVLTVLEGTVPENIHVLVAQASDPGLAADPELQEQAWKKILNVDPNYANSYNMLGYLELNRGNYQQAIEYMQKYAFLAPEQANPHDSMGEVLMVMGRYEEAEAEFVASVTMQPDFYHSLINLGKVYLARGQIAKGVDILEKVRSQVIGSDLEKKVDQEIINTFINSGLDDQIDRMTAMYIDRYPEDGSTCFYRGVRLAARGLVAEGQAVVDSCLAEWRTGWGYRNSPEVRLNIDSAARRYDALASDYNDPAVTRVRMWSSALAMVQDKWPSHELWFYRYRLAGALRDNGEPEAALAELAPILAVNQREPNILALAVQCHVDLGNKRAAAELLDQFQWAVSKSDPDYYGRAKAAELAPKVAGLPDRT